MDDQGVKSGRIEAEQTKFTKAIAILKVLPCDEASSSEEKALKKKALDILSKLLDE